MTTPIRNLIRTVTAAALLALTVVSVSSGSVDAKPRRPVTFGTCAVAGPMVGEDDEDWVFFLPGEEIVAYDSAGRGHVLRCGADGRWHDTGKTVIRPGGTVPTAPLSGGALAQP